MYKAILTSLIAIVFIASFGCASSGENTILPDPATQDNLKSLSGSSRLLLGHWDVNLKPDDVEIVPVRGAQFTANVTMFMQPPGSPVNHLKIQIDPASDFPSGYVVVDVSFTHPFAGLDMYTGFDVMGTVIGNGSTTGLNEYLDVTWSGENDLRLLNADGYTRWFNQAEFTSYGTLLGSQLGALGTPDFGFSATLNGYKYYCDYLDKDEDIASFFDKPDCLNPRGYFTAGNTNTRRYELQFPIDGSAPQLDFQYAVVATWEQSDPTPPENVPDDFPISANCAEAYCISIADQSDMYYVNASDFGGTMDLLVRVFDHQGAFNDDIPSQIHSIHLETPGGLIDSTFITFDSTYLAANLIGTDDVSATFQLSVPAVTPYESGFIPVLVAVESNIPANYDSGLPGFDFPDAPLAAYYITEVFVDDQGAPSDLPPIAVAEVLTDPPLCPGDPVEFDASGSYDQDENGNSIVSYEWDFDGDGNYGDSYDSGTDENPTTSFENVGVYFVDVRVTDDEGMTDTLDEPLSVIVGGPTWVDDDAVPPYDGSFDNPYPTIQMGIDNSPYECGERLVLVKDGTYEETIDVPSNISVHGYSTPAPLIRTAVYEADTMIDFGTSSDATFKHFRAQPRLNGAAIYSDYNVASDANLVIEDFELVNNTAGPTCEYFIDCYTAGTTIKNIRCDGYEQYQNNDGDTRAFLIRVGGDNCSVTDCILLNLDVYAIPNGNTFYHNAIRFYPGDNQLLARNVVGHMIYQEVNHPPGVDYYCGPFRILGRSFYGNSNIVIRNNLCFDIDEQSDIYTPYNRGLMYEWLNEATIEHNTFTGIYSDLDNSYSYGMVLDHWMGPDELNVRSNIISSIEGRFARGFYGSSYGDDIYIDYSCTFDLVGAFTYHYYGNCYEGTGCLIDTDPDFMDPDNDDYRLNTGSPCIGTGHNGSDMGAYGGDDPLQWLPE